MSRTAAGRLRGEGGTGSLELLLLTPLLIVVLLGLVQVGLVVQAGQVAQDAALAAARADRDRDVSPALAASRAADGFDVAVTGGPAAWTAEIDVRPLLPFVDVQVRRTAELPPGAPREARP